MESTEQAQAEPQARRDNGEQDSSATSAARASLSVISVWRDAMKLAARKKVEADVIEAKALVAAYGNPELKNDAARKASATIASADAALVAELAQAEAKAAGAMVDLFLGGRAR